MEESILTRESLTTATPFVTSTLKTFTRDHREDRWAIRRNYYWYAKDGDPSETSEEARQCEWGKNQIFRQVRYSNNYSGVSATMVHPDDYVYRRRRISITRLPFILP